MKNLHLLWGWWEFCSCALRRPTGGLAEALEVSRLGVPAGGCRYKAHNALVTVADLLCRVLLLLKLLDHGARLQMGPVNDASCRFLI
jgi:hypothetical protein